MMTLLFLIGIMWCIFASLRTWNELSERGKTSDLDYNTAECLAKITMKRFTFKRVHFELIRISLSPSTSMCRYIPNVVRPSHNLG